MSNITHQLVTLLSKKLAPNGFSQTLPHVLLKQNSDHFDLILFGSRKDVASGTEMCSFNVGICFPMIESIIDTGEELKFHPTIGSPIHLLTKDQTFHEWPLEYQSFEIVQSEIMIYINSYALPFFDSLNNIIDVVDRLSKENPSEWLSMTPVRRAEVLGAGLYVIERKNDAIEFLKCQIEGARHKLPKYRLPLQRLLQRLLESDPFDKS